MVVDQLPSARHSARPSPLSRSAASTLAGDTVAAAGPGTRSSPLGRAPRPPTTQPGKPASRLSSLPSPATPRAPASTPTHHRHRTTSYASPSTPTLPRPPTPPTPTAAPLAAGAIAHNNDDRPAPPSPPDSLSTLDSPSLVLPSAFDEDHLSERIDRSSVSDGTHTDDEDLNRLQADDGDGGRTTVGRLGSSVDLRRTPAAGEDGSIVGEGLTEGGEGTRASFWDGTEPDDVEVDEDLEHALAHVRDVALDRVTGYKRLLEQSQTSFATQLHALQTELQASKHALSVLAQSQAARSAGSTATDGMLRVGADRATANAGREGRVVGVGEMADGAGGWDRAGVRRFVGALRSREERLDLLGVVLDACMPGDVSVQIAQLERYRKASFDVLSHLPGELALEILSYLDVGELLEKSLVSKRWQKLVQEPELWRYHALRLTEADPVGVRAPSDPAGWLGVYKALHYREANWATGRVQAIEVLAGHTSFVTSLALHGGSLLTGSYDETIRVWDLASGKCKLVLQAKAIACLAFCPEAQVFAVGFHDVGRTQVWSSVTYQPLQTLSGHLHGIRSVALDGRHLVSAGADKAIVVWDWRTGSKVTRFGQQTNVNVGLSLADDKVVSVTLDGVIRCFSISRREMVAQYKLSDLAPADFGLSLRLQHVGGGHLGSGQLAWMAAQGKHLTCATKSLIVHLEWEMGDELVPDLVDFPFCPPTSAGSSTIGAPATVAAGTTPRNRVASTLSLTKPVLTSSSAATPSSPSHLSPTTANGPTRTPRGRPSSSSLTPSPSGALGKGRPSSRPSSSTTPTGNGDKRGPSAQQEVKGKVQRVPLLTRPPRIVSVVDTPEVSMGAVDPRKKRVVTSTRFSSRSGAERKLYVSTYVPLPSSTPGSDASSTITKDGLSPPPVALLPSVVRGAWAAHPELGTSEKGPMSLELDHEKIVVGCQDGTVYVAHMAGHKYTDRSSIGIPPSDYLHDATSTTAT